MAEQPELTAFPPVPHQPPDIHKAVRNRLIQVQDDHGNIAQEPAYLLEDSNDVQMAYLRWPRPGIPVAGRGRIVLANLLLRVQESIGEMVFRRTCDTVVIKELHRRVIDPPLIAFNNGTGGPVNENPYNEISVMQHHGDHEHILDCHEALRDRDFLYIVMLYVQGGDLFSNINWGLGGGYYLPHEVSQVARQLARNLKYLEDRDLVHRDLKPENIMRESFDFPFIDCAMALQIPRVEGNRQLIASQGAAGSRCYIAPEVFGLQAFDHKADVWAFGSILFNLLTGLRFYDIPVEEDIVYNFFITQGGLRDGNLRERRLQELRNNGGGDSHLGQCIHAVQDLTPEVRELLTRILNPNPRNRPDMNEWTIWPFFTDDGSVVFSAEVTDYPRNHMGLYSPYLGREGRCFYY